MFSDEIGEELVIVNKFDTTDPVVGQAVKEVTLMSLVPLTVSFISSVLIVLP